MTRTVSTWASADQGGAVGFILTNQCPSSRLSLLEVAQWRAKLEESCLESHVEGDRERVDKMPLITAVCGLAQSKL